MTLDLLAPVDALDHTRGIAGGPQLVVYGDFECPYTAAAMRDITRLLDSGAAVEVVFRHFPLRTIHPHAQEASQTAEAASEQGRFWEMHDLLFRNRRQLEGDDLRRYAEQLGLDLGRFDADLAADATRTRIKRDVRSGLQSGVAGTPSLFIGGQAYDGPRDPQSLAQALR